MNSLNDMREQVARYAIVYLWLNLPIAIGAALWLGNGWLFPLLVVGGMAAAGTLSWKFWGASAQSRYVITVCQIGMPAVLVYQFAGHAWQLDLHMYFFASVALLAAFCDWRAILLATVAVALHHLVLNFALPAAIFPNGADFTRVVLHAVIVVVEAGTLIWLTSRLVAAFMVSEQAVDEAKAATAKSVAMSEEKLKAEQATEQARRNGMIELADRFEKSVMVTVNGVGGASEELARSTDGLGSRAERAAERTGVIAERSGEATRNVESVAAAAEQLAASINEISGQMNRSRSIAESAVREVQDTTSRVRSLEEASQRIGEVVSLINDIASQTNLLALNATIEAARAGEAGKGFAVVASEVKNLATQTAKATEDIAAQIDSIQSATGGAVQAIAGISETIDKLNEISTVVAAAVEEQSAATSEISHHAQSAVSGTAEVNSAVGDISTDVNDNRNAFGELRQASQELAGQAETLRRDIGIFMSDVRAA